MTKRFIVDAAFLSFTALLIACIQYSPCQAQTSPAPAWTINQQKTTLTVKLPSNPPATLTLDTADVDKMIDMLAQMRAEMKPSRPIAGPAPGARINVATVGNWWVQPDGTGVDLAILHPGYGWVGLELDQNALERLNRRLSLAIHRAPTRRRIYEHR